MNSSFDIQFLNEAAEGVIPIGGKISIDPNIKKEIIRNSSVIPALKVSSLLCNSCPGKTGFDAIPPTTYLNNCQVDKIQKLLIAGTSGTALIAAIVSETGAGAVVAGVIATALGVYGAGLGLCNWNKQRNKV